MMMLGAPLLSTIPTPVSLNRSGFGIGMGRRKVKSNGLAVVAAVQNGGPVTGIVFQPFEEVKTNNLTTPILQQLSLARQNFVDDSESAINEQINVEYSVSYVYHSMFAYFDRDNVGLKGFAKFFKNSSLEERNHADRLMIYQNKRGGKVKLHSILMPSSEFDHPEKGDALHAMELTLSLEKLVHEKLLYLHRVAQKSNDHQLQGFISGEFLTEQVTSIKMISEYVSQLRMIGKGYGVWQFDQMLQSKKSGWD